jgi:hypothetical protein
VESPAKRRRPNDEQLSSQKLRQVVDDDVKTSPASFHAFADGPISAGGVDMQQELLNWEGNMAPYSMQGMGLSSGMDFNPFDPTMSMSFDDFNGMSTVGDPDPGFDNGIHPGHKHSSSADTSPSCQSIVPVIKLGLLPHESTSAEPSLDKQLHTNAQIIGLSGESDPYLLSRYRYNQYNEASFGSVRIRKMCDANHQDGTLPAFFYLQPNALTGKAQPPGSTESLDRYRKEVDDMVSEEDGKRLIKLFYKYVQPYFPVLSRSHGVLDEHGTCEPRSVPTCILAAIYGHTLPFCPWDEKLCLQTVYTPPSADSLFRIAWLACQPEFHTPSLSVLQTLLLLVQRRPTNKHVSDTPFKWVIMTTAVSIAQSLGINRSPEAWPLPEWEMKLRKRLAWATFVQDKWLSLNTARSSHISADDWDVRLLEYDDFEEQDRAPIAEDVPGCEHFMRLCELTEIVDDILRDLFSLRATRALGNSLEATLEAAKPLRIRITEWNQQLPEALKLASLSSTPSGSAHLKQSPSHELDGNGSLYLAHITAKIELFRAMLRTTVTDSTTNAFQALRTGALAVAREIFDFLDNLGARELEAFWTSYSRANFTIASSFMLHLFVSSPGPVAHAQECLALLEAWRALLRLKSRSCDMLNLALLRLDGTFVAGLDKLVELSPAAAEAWAARSVET